MAEKPVYEQVNDLLNKWNKPPEDQTIARVVGSTPPEGDTRATQAYVDPAMDHDRNPASDSVDAQRMYADDADGDGDALLYGEDLDDLDKSALQEQAEKRDLAKSGNMKEIRERIDEHDAADEDDDDEDDSEDE